MTAFTLSPAIAWLERNYNPYGLTRDYDASVGHVRHLFDVNEDHYCPYVFADSCQPLGDACTWYAEWPNEYIGLEDEDDLSYELDEWVPLRLWSDWEVRQPEAAGPRQFPDGNDKVKEMANV